MKDYDVIVIGGGSAGCLVAGRLATETEAEVLLLEAGGWDLNPLVHIPAGFSKLMEHGLHTYDYSTVPQHQLDGKPKPFAQGRGIGGGGSINAMAYVRGQARDYERWQAAAGEGGGWTLEDLMPHFLAAEGNTIFADRHHNTDGPLRVSLPTRINALNLAAIRGFQQAGLPFNPDYNGAVQGGVSPVQVTIGDARRCSAAGAFLHPARRRPNLTVRTRARTERVLLDGARAVGAEFVQHRRRRRVRARQVILCAGSFNSPRILMLSGIGPEEELARHGIATRTKSPDVGRHLQDHPKVSITARARDGLGYAKDAGGPRMIADGLAYLLVRDGPAASNGIESVSYFNPEDPDGDPTIQTYHVPLGGGAGSDNSEPGLTLENVVLQPRSRGSVRLRDADPASEPLIDPNWLDDPEDMRRMIGALRYVRGVTQTKALREVLEVETHPGPDKQTDEELTEYARSALETMWHCVGTCRMGADEDAVVDAELAVRGVEGLRVIDASVMPAVTSTNTNAPTIMIAEKGAMLVRAAARHRQAAAA
jgi:choline dehydrogenase